jgi:DNA primase
MINNFKELKKLISIQDVVELVTPVRGKTAKCPFHDDGRASMILGEKYGTYKCLACDVKGDAIDFWARYRNTSMCSAARELSEKFQLGLEFKDNGGEDVCSEMQKGLELRHLDFLAGRGIEEESIAKYKIGASGDFICFPLWSETGKLLGFNRRSIYEKNYLLPEGLIKESLLGNLNFVKDKFDTCLVTEGFIDCIQALQEGIGAVCTFGVGLSSVQARMLDMHFSHIVLAYDNDEAGITSALAAFETIKSINPRKHVMFAKFTDGSKDLGEHLYINSGVEHIDLIDFCWEKKVTYEETTRLIGRAKSFVDRRLFAMKLAERLNVRVEDVFLDMEMVKS